MLAMQKSSPLLGTAQEARTLVHKLMVTGPLVLALGIGVQSRTAFDNWEPRAYTQAYSQRIESYQSLATDAEALLGRKHATNAEYCQLAARWIEAKKTGRITNLEPADYEDTSAEGVKAQILKLRTDVALHLIRGAEALELEGKTAASLKQATLATEFIEASKYFDLNSVFGAGLTQRMAIAIIERQLPNADEATSKSIRGRLAALLSGQKRLDGLTLLTRRQFETYRRQNDREPLAIEDSERVLAMDDIVAPNADLNKGVQDLRDMMLASTDPEVPDLLSEVRGALVSQSTIHRKLDAILGNKPDPTLERPTH